MAVPITAAMVRNALGVSKTDGLYSDGIIGSNIREFIEPSLARSGLSTGDVETWAVHPGGKAIIDQVQSKLGLRPEQVAASRETLREHGNMSSATILFVLRDILRSHAGKAAGKVCAMAFGPGMTVEMALLDAVPARPIEASHSSGSSAFSHAAIPRGQSV